MKHLTLRILLALSSVALLGASSSTIQNIGNSGINGTDWTAITLTLPCSASTTQTIYATRTGDSLRVRGAFQCGTVTTGNAQIDLPSGYTINLSKLTVQGYSKVGDWHVKQNSNTQINASLQSGHLFVDGSDNNTVWLATNVSSLNYVYITNTTSILGSTERMEIDFTIPISGWTTGGNATQIRSAIYAYNLAGHGSTRTKNPYFTTTSVSGSDLTLTSNNSTNGLRVTVNTAGIYYASCQVVQDYVAVGLNDNGTTNASALGNANLIAGALGTSAGTNASGIKVLAAGDVVTCVTQGTATGASDVTGNFSIVKIGN